MSALGTSTLLLLGTLLTSAAAAAEWRLVGEQDGIALYRAASERSTVRAVGVVASSLPHVLAVLRDVPRHVEWRSRCIESRILGEPESRKIAILYNRIAGSWPISDRDTVLRSETRVDGPGAAHIDLQSAISPRAPNPGDVVRMHLDGRYVLRAEDTDRTRVTYQMRIALGGDVPDWIADYATEDMPLATIAGLRTQLAATRGTYRAFEEAWPASAARGEIPDVDFAPSRVTAPPEP